MGLAFACELARRGVEVAVCAPAEPDAGLPLVLGARAREHWHHLGLPAPGHRLHGLTVLAEGERVAQFSFDELSTPFPSLAVVPEGVGRLRSHAESLGVHFVQELGPGAVYDAEEGEGEVVGRQVLARFGGVPDDEALVVLGDFGLLAILPCGEGRALVRVEGESPRALDGWQRLLNEYAPDGAWMNEVVADEALVEAAARVGPQVLGWEPQALHQDFEDARNLGWKVALVELGRSDPSILDSYAVERGGLRARQTSAARFPLRVVSLRRRLPEAWLDRLIPHLARLEPVQERMARERADLHLGYRGSPLVDEDREPFVLSRLGRDDSAERPTFATWLDFSNGPGPGDRAPDCGFGPGGHRRLREALRGEKHCLLLFDGIADTEEGYRTLARIALDVEARYGDVVAVCVVVPSNDRPAALEWDGPMLQDPEFTLHTAYGARSECLYLVRPDGFVGYRSQPAEYDGLLAHLEGLFVD